MGFKIVNTGIQEKQEFLVPPFLCQEEFPISSKRQRKRNRIEDNENYGNSRNPFRISPIKIGEQRRDEQLESKGVEIDGRAGRVQGGEFRIPRNLFSCALKFHHRRKLI